MAVRFYLMPTIDDGFGRLSPKYISTLYNPAGGDVLKVRAGLMRYGFNEEVYLAAADVTTPQHNALVAHADVTTVPANIDGNISAGALQAVKDALEVLRIPGNWVTTGHTYRQVLRTVAGLFQFSKRHFALHNKILIPTANNMDHVWSDLPLAVRQELQATADALGYDYSGVTGSTPLRTILKSLADQWGSQPFDMGGVTTL